MEAVKTPGIVTPKATVKIVLTPEQEEVVAKLGGFEKVLKGMESTQKTLAWTKAYDKAVRDATNELRKAHKAQYEALLNVSYKAHGITRKGS